MGSTLFVWLKERNGKQHSDVAMACMSTESCPSGYVMPLPHSRAWSIEYSIDLLDEGVIAYLVDINIYSEDEESHIDLVRRVMERIRQAKLCVSINKSVIHQREVVFLGYYISESGISMTTDKVEAVKSWLVPRNVKDLQAFLAFANFYQGFIQGISKVCKPLTDLTRKGNAFAWSTVCEDAFQHLKQLFTQGTILENFDADRPTRVETMQVISHWV